jgi:hypothetical protein
MPPHSLGWTFKLVATIPHCLQRGREGESNEFLAAFPGSLMFK